MLFRSEVAASPTGKVNKLTMPEVIVKSVARYPIPESFSLSSVSSFRKCPLEYKYRHLLKLPSPGGPALSYGSTIHKTVELFLKLWQSRKEVVQADLFGKTPAACTLPTFNELMELYEKSWIDDWYDSKKQKAEYRTKKGPAHLKNFYDTFVAAPPTIKYIEQFFKIGMGPYKFTGKIDRLDAREGGGAIIDYKTTAKPPANLEKVDRDQLKIYQIAAQEFLREPVVSAQYWYLESNTLSDPFVASAEDLSALKSDYTKVIEKIIQTVERNSFLAADEAATKHECKFRHLE